MNAYAPLARLRPLAAAALMTLCAGAVAQTYAPPPAPAAPAYDNGDPANANLAPIDRSPQPPPPLPVYAQPPAPGDGYMWVPGYWSLNRYGFFWVPGAWVLAPYAGALWTPGYWGFVDGIYRWHAGYWGPHIGFYGGINYGFGYIGIGYVGGYWNHDRFYYNRAVTNVNVTRVTNVYNHTVVVNNNIDNRRVSYNGGPAGIQRRLGRVADEGRRDHVAFAVPERNDTAQRLGAHRQLGDVLRPQILDLRPDALQRRPGFLACRKAVHRRSRLRRRCAALERMIAEDKHRTVYCSSIKLLETPAPRAKFHQRMAVHGQMTGKSVYSCHRMRAGQARPAQPAGRHLHLCSVETVRLARRQTSVRPCGPENRSR